MCKLANIKNLITVVYKVEPKHNNFYELLAIEQLYSPTISDQKNPDGDIRLPFLVKPFEVPL